MKRPAKRKSMWNTRLNWRDPAVLAKFYDALQTKRTLSEVATEMGVSYDTIHRRVNDLEKLAQEIERLRKKRAGYGQRPMASGTDAEETK